MATVTASSPFHSIPESSNAALLPGSRSSMVHIWPNPLPLECGVIRLQEKLGAGLKHHGGGQRFPLKQLRKLLLYIKNKGKMYYPNICYACWSHIATNKFNMTEDLAWLYFETFDVVSEISARERLDLLKLTSKCSSKDELNELRRKLSVDTLQFILFLYLQNAPRASLKTPMVASEEWPSPESEPRQKSSEHYHLMFLRANLLGVMELLQEPDSGHLSEESVKALGFIFSVSRHSKPSSLLDLATSAAPHSGYSKISQKFSLPQFEFWLRSFLVMNPHGPHYMLSHRRELRPAPCFRSDSNGKLLVNPAIPVGFRSSVLHHVNKQTLASCDEGLQHSSVYIRNCRRSNIYLLAPLRSVHIEKCSRCVLVLGAVTTSVMVSNSDSLTVVTACRKINISSSSMCVFHLLTMTRPVLLPGCSHITFAPYHTHYPSLGKHLLNTGLSPSTNCWDSPLDLTGGGATTTQGLSHSSWELLPPHLFRPIEIPFDLPGSTGEIPCPLPPPYLQAMEARKQRLSQWYDTVGRAQLSGEQAKQLWASVKDHFDEWLSSEGHKKELVDLGLKSMALPFTTYSSNGHSKASTLSQSGALSHRAPAQSSHHTSRSQSSPHHISRSNHPRGSLFQSSHSSTLAGAAKPTKR